MAEKTLTSQPFKITSQQLPGLTKPLNFRTETTFTPDVNGNPIAGTQKTILQYQATPNGVFQAAATSTKGGKPGSWSLINAANTNTPILGATTIKSLQTPNGALNKATQNSVISAATNEKIAPSYQKPLADKLSNTSSATKPNNPTVTAFNDKTTTGLNPNIKYIYPLNMDVKQDCIKFEIFRLKRSPGKDFKGNVASALRKQTEFGRKGEAPFYDKIEDGRPIYMGIQGSIVDQNIADWGSGQLNELQRMLLEGSAGMMTNKGGIDKVFSEGFKNLYKQVESNSTEFKGLLYTYLLEQAVGVPNLTSRLTGGVLNPNMELLFQGPQLRPFNFTFKMSPREKPEADVVKAIIKAFKRNMAPKVNGLFLQSPHVFKFEIEYIHGKTNSPHKSINLIKMCSLQNCSVDYTPLQTYMTYDDNIDPEASMVAYNMTLSFSEITPIYQDDYDYDVKDHPIGF